MPDGEPQFKKDHKGIEREKFITHQSWRKYMACLKLHREVKAGCRHAEDLGYMPQLGSTCRKLQGSQAKSRLVNSNQEKQGFGKLCGGHGFASVLTAADFLRKADS